MQTFLPFADFQKSAEVLDYRRLGKQRVECLQILRAILGESTGWINHPATRMWRSNPKLLLDYGVAICKEWTRRGFSDSCLTKMLDSYYENEPKEVCSLPWLGDERFHSSHRAALLAKDFGYYSKFGWSERPEINYFWPV